MSLWSIFLYFVLPFVIAGYFYLKKKFSYFEERGIPFIKANSWILGSFGEIRTKYHLADFMIQSYKACKGKDVIAGYYSMFSPTILVTDLEMIKNITVRDFNYFTGRGAYVNEDEDKISGHLFSLEGDKWKFLRNKLSPVFTSGKIKMMFETVVDKGDHLVAAIEEASKLGSIEMKQMANRFTVDAISSCVFGMESNTLKNEHKEFLEFFKEIYDMDGEMMMKSLFLTVFPKLSKMLNLRFFKKKTEDFMYANVGGTMKYREENNVVRNDFLNMLMQLKNKGSIDGEFSTDIRKLSYDECIAQAFIFFFAGADTTSSSIAFALAELGLHQDIQEKLRNEINEKSGAKITYENLQEMVYLNQVVNETLRRYPSAFFLVRKTSQDYKVPGTKHVIEKDTIVMIPSIGIHYDEEYWKNPKEFDPERFSAEETAKRPSLTFMPFGEGPRNCIGMRFGLINFKFAIATIIKNFKVTTDVSKTVVPLSFNPKAVTIELNGGFFAKFEKIC